MKQSLEQFGQTIKAKYPGSYDDMSDSQLAQTMLKKYPQYSDMVDTSSKKSLIPQFIRDLPVDIAKKTAGALGEFIGGTPTKKMGEKFVEHNKEYVPAATTLAASALVPEVGIPASMALNAGLSGGQTALEGGNAKDIVKDAGIGGALGAIPGGLGMAAEKFSPALVKGASKIGNLISSVPEEDYNVALNSFLKGKSIFKNAPKNENEYALQLAERAKEAAKSVRNTAGEASHIARRALTDAELKGQSIPRLESDPLKDDIQDFIKLNTGSKGGSWLDNSQRKSLQDLTLELSQKDIPLDEGYYLKKRIDNLATKDAASPGGPTPFGAFLGELSDKINQQVEKKAPGFYNANQAYSNAADAMGKIGSKLRDFNTEGASLLSNVRSERPLMNSLEQVDKAAPEDLKFLDDVKAANARKSFSRFLPGQGGGSGSTEGAANIIRASAVGALGATGKKWPTFATAGLISPLAHQYAMRSGFAAANALEKVPVNKAQLMTRLMDQLRRNKEEVPQ